MWEIRARVLIEQGRRTLQGSAKTNPLPNAAEEGEEVRITSSSWTIGTSCVGQYSSCHSCSRLSVGHTVLFGPSGVVHYSVACYCHPCAPLSYGSWTIRRTWDAKRWSTTHAKRQPSPAAHTHRQLCPTVRLGHQSIHFSSTTLGT